MMLVQRVVPIVLVALALTMTSCERPSARSAANADDDTLRIVSLSPAISRTLVDFELDERIVGRTQFCASIDPSVPVVGSLLDLDYERVLKLRPTHVLVQPSLAQGVDPRLRELAESHGWVIGEFPGLNDIDDVDAMILKLPELLFADTSDARRDAAARAAEISTNIAAALRPDLQSPWHGGTLLVASVDPVLVFGTQTYLGDVLTALGGVNAAGSPGWSELSLEDIVRLDPEAIVLVRERAVEGDVRSAAGPLASLPIRAVREDRIAALVHPDVNLPSSGVIGVAHALREVLNELASPGAEGVSGTIPATPATTIDDSLQSEEVGP